ncbi:MAG: SIMPL domain-containing protein [Thermoproteales archaeon]|nr:SIMPL domain-containing protein [Thermoproteales archaeon]
MKNVYKHLTIGITVLIAVSALVFFYNNSRLNLKSPTNFSPEARSLPTSTNITVIKVSGIGVVKTRPNMIYFSLYVEVEADTPAEALSTATSHANKLVSYLKSKGIQDQNITTTNVALTPVYDYNQKPPKIVAYKAYYSLRVHLTDLKLAEEILGDAINHGATGLGQISFGISEEKSKELRLQAIKLAYENALKTAEALAEAAGLRITGIKSMSVQSGYTPPIYYAKAEAGSVPLMPGEGQVSVSVYVEFIAEP